MALGAEFWSYRDRLSESRSLNLAKSFESE